MPDILNNARNILYQIDIEQLNTMKSGIIAIFFLLFSQIHASSIVVKTNLNEADSVSLLTSYGNITRTIRSLNAYVLKVSDADLTSIISDLELRPDIVYVHEDASTQPMSASDFVLNDPEIVNQWFLDNMDMFEVWKYFPWKEENKVTLAILDSGLDQIDNPDLQNLVISPLSYNMADKDYNITDIGEHGTVIAALVAAAMNNSLGTTGLIPKVELMIIKIWGGGGGQWSTLADAVTYAADNGAKVINLSGGGLSGAPVLEDAVNYSFTKGSLLTTSGGNSKQDGNALFCPPCYNQSIAVGGLQEDGTWWIYANTGPQIDIVAPASKLRAPIRGEYTDNYGTSFSSPIVAACIAYIWNQNPSLTNEEVREILYSTAHDLGDAGKDDYYGYGNVNLLQALKGVTNQPPALATANVVNILKDSAINQSFVITAPEEWDTVDIIMDDSTLNYTIVDNTLYLYSAARPLGKYTATVRAFDSLNASSSFVLTVNVVDVLPTPSPSVSEGIVLATSLVSTFVLLVFLLTL